MSRTLLAIIIFIIITIFIAFIFSSFFAPKEQLLRYQDCILLQNKKTGAVDCFGCANNICKDATTDWVIYQKPEFGIPYACLKTEKGCQLAQ